MCIRDRAKAKRTQLAALDTALAAAEKELTALEDAPTRLLALQNREHYKEQILTLF